MTATARCSTLHAADVCSRHLCHLPMVPALSWSRAIKDTARLRHLNISRKYVFWGCRHSPGVLIAWVVVIQWLNWIRMQLRICAQHDGWTCSCFWHHSFIILACGHAWHANGFECQGHSLAALLASEVGHNFGQIWAPSCYDFSHSGFLDFLDGTSCRRTLYDWYIYLARPSKSF